MAAPLLLIDGYNLLHAAGMAPPPRAAVGELQRGRERLLSFLGERLTPAERARTMVVFDARDPPAHRPPALTMNGVRVLFALPEGDADLILERLLGEQASRHVTVVSSDRRVQSAARSRRARFEESDAFFTRLDSRRTKTKSSLRDPKEHGLSASEAEAWLVAFGTVDVNLDADTHPPQTPSLPTPTVDQTVPGVAVPAKKARQARSKKKAKPADDLKPVSDLHYWLSVFQHLEGATLDDLDQFR